MSTCATDWRDRAACRWVDPEWMFPKGIPGRRAARQGVNRTQRAKAVCIACPVVIACRQWALDNRVEYGVWGGLAEEERRDILADQAGRNGSAQCGTESGARRHRRLNEALCAWCGEAQRLAAIHHRTQQQAERDRTARTNTPRPTPAPAPVPR